MVATAAEFVNVQACDRCRENTRIQLHSIGKSIIANTEDITDLKVVVGKLTQLTEIQTQTLAAIEQKQDKKTKSKFWETKAGLWTVVGIVAIAVMLTMAAIGQNYLDDLKPFIEKGVTVK